MVPNSRKAKPAAKSLSPLGAMAFMALGVFGFGVADVSVKWLTADYSTWQIMAVGRIPALVVALYLTHRATGNPFRLYTRHIRLHALRSVLTLVTAYSFFEALRYLPLVDCITIAFAAPLFVAALSGPLIGESVGLRRWLAVVVGFAGVVIALIAQPQDVNGFFNHLNKGALLVLASAFAYSLVLITLRSVSGKDSTHNIMFHTTAATLVIIIPFAAHGWVWPDFTDSCVMAVMGIGSAVAQLCMIHAFRSGEASMLAPLEYTALIWATFFGWLIWSEFPTIQLLAGAAIIIGANIYIAQREVHHARLRANFIPENPALPE